jgi:predicted PurR-regulated permease PerM
MNTQRQLIFWGAALAAFIAILVFLGSVILPFALGMVVAYLLNPLVRRMCGAGMSRRFAVLTILGIFLLLIVLFGVAVGPLLYREIVELCSNIPVYINRLWDLIEPASQRVLSIIDPDKTFNMRATLTEQMGPSLSVANSVLLGVVAGGQAVLHVVSIIVIMPIVAYFMMKEWNYITSRIEGLIPLDRKETVTGLLGEIDRKLSGFIRGQLSVMFILGITYAIALTLLGVKYGFLIGLMSGLLSVIPLVGSTIGFITGISVAFFQSGGDWMFILMVAGVFLCGQLIEGNFLTPVLVGESIGLHPLWIFFALLAGGSLFGILGMVLAVPMAAIVSVLLSFGIKQYKSSPFYMGHNLRTDPRIENGGAGPANPV